MDSLENTENILELRNVSKAYKNFTLKDVSFTLKRGFIMGLIGENGAGKTTTIKLIMNLIKKQSGEIRIFGKDNIKFEKEVKEKIGFVYDDCFYYEKLSIMDNAKIFSNFYKCWDFNTFKEYLKIFKLNHKQKVKELSKGMKMKFSIALALSHKTEFLILDEPTAGLDPIMRRDLLNILQNLMENENIGILISSHITSDLEKIADYITYIKDGTVLLSSATTDILENYKIIKGSLALLSSIDKSLIIGLRENKYGFQGLIKDIHSIDKKLYNSLIFEKPSIEDIMVYMNKGGNAQ
ncbi:ABC-2 type transport system ATP-binding protein [Hathewaya proteolytica DSM 3090]|uniref:ABC-2 type transport system ATP-binding protein n=1 Tax=Hathewaya proteolytica DSM 3090 TaxID=1121331 RepID=A0A1M6S6V2_9CLOT|nr:ABC transporter ATP-binding protein [Hathewaya proteolytica]SHK40473.1 ABC-2 type transport system ATP-binding protein [Hathewaya proteolytica DSM 3090]